MEKENSATGGGGVGGGDTQTTGTTGSMGPSASDKLQADQANPLLDPSALFGGMLIIIISMKNHHQSKQSSIDFHDILTLVLCL